MKKLILILTLAAFACGPLMAVETAQVPSNHKVAYKIAGKKHKKRARKAIRKHKKGRTAGKRL